MSAVTLETLRADYETAIDRVIFGVLASGKWQPDYLNRLIAALEIAKRRPAVFEDADALQALRKNIEITAKLESDGRTLAVAERDGLQAAMLFKLSGGNIDPRVSA